MTYINNPDSIDNGRGEIFMDPEVYSLKVLPSTREVYTVRRNFHVYTVIKFDGMLNVLTIYKVKCINGNVLSCPCFQGRFGKCRHRPVIIYSDYFNRTNKGWFYDFDLDRWYMPVSMRR